MNPRKVRGIFFDLGDTLLDFHSVHVDRIFQEGSQAAYEYLQQRGKRLPEMRRYRRKNFRAIRREFFKSRFTRREFNSLDLLRRLSRRMGHGLTDEEAVEVAWRYYEPLRRQATTEANLPDVLQRLRGRGLTLGVISNTFVPSEVLDRHLEQEGLLDLLPIRVYSCDVRFRKPHRRIFRIALNQADLEPTETMYVGDSLREDIRGANSAGLISVLKDPTERYRHRSIHPRHRIAKLAELPEIVARYNGG